MRGASKLFRAISRSFRSHSHNLPKATQELSQATPVSRGGWNSWGGKTARRVGAGTLVLGLAATGVLRGLTLVEADAAPPPPGDPAPGGLSRGEEEGGEERRKRVVILGSGWGAVTVLRGIDTSLYEVVVVSPRNYFLFTPLLPGVTAGTVESRSISEPIRRIIRTNKKDAKYYEAQCIDIDPVKKTVLCQDTSAVQVAGQNAFTLEYDYLVMAVGARTNTFNTPGVQEHCHFLKEVEDAHAIRDNIVDCFETANLPSTSEAERRRLLHFVVVGGGPTGCEFAAELHDLVEEDLEKLYPDLKPLLDITLIQSADHILNMFDQRISDYATKHFDRENVHIKTGQRVLSVEDRVIKVKDKWTKKTEDVEYGLCVWSTGIGTQPLVTALMEKIGQKDRRALATDEWLRVKGVEGIFALGDCATVEQARMQDDVEAIFKLADANHDGEVSFPEFTAVIDTIKDRYPQIELHLQRGPMKTLLQDFEEECGKREGSLTVAQFTHTLAKVDSQMKALPATAQVAAQQGEYIGSTLNQLARKGVEPSGPMRIRGTGRHRVAPFRYKHFGTFTTLGSGEAALELPGDWVSQGRSTMWLWYSVYASKQVSWRTRFLVVFDWTKRAIFGRDSSRM